MAKWDLLFKDAIIFDGTGEPPQRGDLAVTDGRVAARGEDLDASMAERVVDAAGKWLMPGLLDIHTHYDLEVELEPSLPESVRHGTTTVVMSNCSLGLAFGAQRNGGADPIVDCFARVENMPKHILEKAASVAEDWDDSEGYLRHLDELPLGPNVVPLIPHSMLRIEVMGLEDSIARDPTERELDEMCALVEKGMKEGYAGFSTDALPFHYLANDPNRRSKIPTQYGTYKELKALTDVVREYEAVWQATPPKDSPPQTLRNFLLSSGRLHGKPLRITAVAAMDVRTNRMLGALGRVLTRILNSRIVDGNFRLQALAAPFKVWSEGPVTPLAEEIPELRRLNEPDLEDREARMRVLDDPEWRAQFRKMWFSGKRGFGLARLKRWLRIEDHTLTRNLEDMVIETCPVKEWNGATMQEVYQRLMSYQNGDVEARSQAERETFDSFGAAPPDDADFFLGLLRQFDLDLYWYTYAANLDEGPRRDLLMDPQMLPGFSDSGAHITNMAFYDVNLRALQIAQKESLDQVAYTVRRLTREPADFFGLDAGRIDRGATADLTLVDPDKLRGYDSESNIENVYREVFEHNQLVNRSEGVVPMVVIGGKLAVDGGELTDALGQVKMGRALRNRRVELPAPKTFRAAAE
ncbi:N-acyl-D-amino-acid deacylase family protein [Persicimonas caeni]|uniref:N-acyl-D-amino-acid deacylase family protein n=1 Tax=Persicimonas caeni TaxID=2292766 RepID=UPI00143D7757|nr:amidohydrolase family protein [Persicimonas caeni]